MKAIVLAGGFAKRLWPLTMENAKALIDVGGRPIIDHIIDKLEDTQVNEIIVSTNAKFGEDFKKWIKTKDVKKKIRIVIENSKKEGDKLGAMGGICYTIQKCNINEDCLIIAGDNIFGFDLNSFIDFYKKRGSVANAVFDVKDRETAKRFGVVTMEKDKITDFVEKPENPPSTLLSAGCYIFPQATLDLFSKYLEEGNNKDAPGFFLQWLHKRQSIYAFYFDTYWFDIGSHEVLEKARQFASENKI